MKTKLIFCMFSLLFSFFKNLSSNDNDYRKIMDIVETNYKAYPFHLYLICKYSTEKTKV